MLVVGLCNGIMLDYEILIIFYFFTDIPGQLPVFSPAWPALSRFNEPSQ